MKPGDYTRGRSRTDAETLIRMLPEMRARAFAVQGVEDFAALKRIQDAVAAMPEGGKWEEMRGRIAAEIGGDDGAGGGTRKRAETILQTNGFQAYGAARWRQQQAMKGAFPYLKYVAIPDGRARDRHAELDGVILPADDPFWKDHYPPWDFNCRCITVQLTEEDAKEEQEAGEGVMWDEGRRKAWMATHAGQDAARQFHFRPDTLGMDLRDLAKAEGRTAEDMEAFGKLMETRRIGTGETDADGKERTESVRDWLWRPLREEYRAKAADADGGGNETVWALDAWTGGEIGRAVGGRNSVSLASLPRGRAMELVHNHPNGNPALSPRDVLAAMREDVAGVEAVAGRSWARVRAKARAPHLAAELAEWEARRARAAARGAAAESAFKREWVKWLEAQRRYGYIEIERGAGA